MSISSNFPAIKPTLLLDFANTEQLDPRITFTRASTATYYGTQTAKAEENLLLQSQTFDNASWTKSNAAVSGTDTIVAPDGTTTAEEVRDGTASNIHNVFQGVTLASGTTYVASVFLKNVDRQYAILAVSGGVSAYASAKFDLTGGTSTANQAAGSGWSVTSVEMTSVGSGWYRCVLVFVSGTSGSCNVRIGLASNGTTFTTNGSGLESYTGTDLKIAVWGAQLEQRSAVTAYTPTTTQTITNYIPVLETAASGVARFDHNPTTFESLGLLIEESRTNLFTYSEQFDNAIWGKNNGTLTANTLVAPDGTLTADLFFEDTTNASHFITYNLASNFTSGTAYTQSYFVKAKGRTRIQLNWRSDWFTPSVEVNFDLVAKTATPSANATASIQEVGNGWFRITATATADATGTSASDTFFYLADASGNISYTGDGTSGIYIWGAQLEAGAFATSYIPTVASQVTRAADAASMTGTNFSSWYNQAEGTFFAQFVPAFSSFGSNKTLFLSSDGTVNNYAGFRYTDSGARPTLSVVVAGTTQAAMPTGTMVAGTSSKMAGAYKVNDFATSRDAGTVGTDTSGTVPVVTQAEIGMLAGTSVGTQTISKLAYYPLRVTNAQLQALTS